MNRSGTLQWRCQRCLEFTDEKPSKNIARDLDQLVGHIVIDKDLPYPVSLHDCADGGLGRSVFVGVKPWVSPRRGVLGVHRLDTDA